MLSMGVDLEAVVDNSYGFLSFMDSGTMPRRRPVPIQIQSWNERSDSRPHSNLSEWEGQFNGPAAAMRSEGRQGVDIQRRPQELVPGYRQPERNGYTSGHSTLWKLTNEVTPNVVQKRYEAPQYQVPQIGQRSVQRLGDEEEQRGPQSMLDRYSEDFQQEREDSLWNKNKEKRILRRHPEESYYKDDASEKGTWDYTQVSEKSGFKEGQYIKRLGGLRDNIMKHPSVTRNEVHHRQGGGDPIYTSQIKAHAVRNQEWPESVHYRKPKNVRSPSPIYPQSSKKPQEGASGANRNVIYAKAPGSTEQGRAYQRSDSSLNKSMEPSSRSSAREIWDERSKGTSQLMSSQKKVANTKERGSFLLQRTNTYLEAVDNLKNRRDGGIIVEEPSEMVTRFRGGSVPVEPPKVPEDSKFPEIRRVGSTNRVNQKITANRMSKEIPDKNLMSVPPPPAPPMPPLTTPTKIKPMKPAVEKQPAPLWLEDLKRGRRELKRVPSLKRIELEPEPEPKTFKEKLERIVQKQLAAQRWHLARPVSKRSEELDLEADVAVGSEPYKTVKTLNKSAMKNKLEKILVKGPPNRPSFQGAFDMDDKRKEAVTRLRAIEKEALEKQRAHEDDDDFDDFLNNSVVNPSVPMKRGPSIVRGRVIEEPIVSRQKLLMGDVMATIKLKGAMNGASYT